MANRQGACTISVIVCTVDRPKDIVRFLDSLDRQTRIPNELIIVDGSSGTETSEAVRGRGGAYPLKYCRTEPGLTRQRNAGVQQSQGDVLCFFDDDVVLHENFIAAVISAFGDGDVGGVAGQIVNRSGVVSRFEQLLKRLFFLIDIGNGRIKLSGFPAHKVDEHSSRVEVLPGGLTAYRRQVFDTFSFDESLSGYGYLEDVDFSYRVSRRFGLMYQPLAKVEHYPSMFRTCPPRQLRRMLVRNHLYLFRKNMPKTPARIYGFVMSILGLLLFNSLINHSPSSCVGIIEGLFDRISLPGGHSCESA